MTKEDCIKWLKAELVKVNKKKEWLEKAIKTMKEK